MAIGYAAFGTANAVGYDATGQPAATTIAGTAKAVGYAALGIPATPAVSASPDALRLEIVDSAGAQLVPDLPCRNLTFTVEHNGAGSISFETDLDNFPEGLDDPLLDPTNLVRVHFGDLPGWPYGVGEFVLASAPPTKGDSGCSLSVQGTGSWDLLDLGVLWPPSGATGETREFSYTAGQTGPSWVPAEWGTPVGKRVKDSFRWAHRWPSGWPENYAQWIWSTSPEKWSPLGVRQFVSVPGAFDVATPGVYEFNVAGDENLRLYLNGALIKKKRWGAWKKTCRFRRTLAAGSYTLAASVKNLDGGDNKSGFACAVARLKADGTRDSWVLRSSPNTFQVKKASGYFAQVPLPPDGWYPAAVLHTHVGEAAARGVDFHTAIVRTYSATADSAGVSWTTKGPAEYDIGTSGAQLGEKIRSLGVDLAMLPGLRLSAWAKRGFDLRNRVVISRPAGMSWTSRTWSRVRTQALTHHESGWTETAGDSSLVAEFGRRELTVSGGGTDGDLQADALATATMLAAAGPEETIEATVSTAQMVGEHPQPMPFRDYNVADVVMFETVGEFTPVKVMSITGAEQESGEVRFTISGYPV
jgi:hypothetical protein